MKKVLEKRKDIAFYIKMFPLPMHKDSYAKAKAIICENSVTLLDDAFAHKELPAPSCETKQVDDDLALGKKLGITGTPALIFPDGSLVSGAMDADSIIKKVEKE
jgi:thiol:disulfide interchange protein DsbC